MPVVDTTRRSAISVPEAFSIVRSHAELAPVERRRLQRAAGLVLREEVAADRDFPPFDRVTMDGIALSFASYKEGRREFRIEGVQAAGAPRQALASKTGCIEVMTGAVLPSGCDCVVPVETITLGDASAVIDPDGDVARMQNIHREGSDHRAGDVLLSPGIRLRSPEIAVCATVGKSELSVSRPARIAVVSTGDELVEIEAVPKPHQIRTSNGFAVQAALAAATGDSPAVSLAADRSEPLAALFSDLLSHSDVLVVSGGVSAGKFDLVPAALEGLGVRTLFHRVMQRPGYPLWFGVSPEGCVVFALPGNPVSALVSTHRYVIPYVRKRSGAAESTAPVATLTRDYRFDRPMTLFLPVRLHAAESGKILADPVEVNGSGDLAGITQSDGFIELPSDRAIFEDGSSWPLYRWE